MPGQPGVHRETLCVGGGGRDLLGAGIGGYRTVRSEHRKRETENFLHERHPAQNEPAN